VRFHWACAAPTHIQLIQGTEGNVTKRVHCAYTCIRGQAPAQMRMIGQALQEEHFVASCEESPKRPAPLGALHDAIMYQPCITSWLMLSPLITLCNRTNWLPTTCTCGLPSRVHVRVHVGGDRRAAARAIMGRLPLPPPTNPKVIALSADRLGTAMSVVGEVVDKSGRGSLQKQACLNP
jgi:hypothetical protein